MARPRHHKSAPVRRSSVWRLAWAQARLFIADHARGFIVFAAGVVPVVLASQLGWGQLTRFGLAGPGAQLAQFATSVIAFAGGAALGALVVVIGFLFLRFRDIAFAVLALLTLYLTLAPGVGFGMPALLGPAGLVVGGLTAWLYLFGFPRLPRVTTFGSAEWADADHIARAGLFEGDGYWLGTYPVPAERRSDPPEQKLIRYNGDRHLLTFAPTRGGKGVSAIIPNLLTYRGSVIVIDPKGENTMITLLARHGMGQRIHVVDPWGIAVSRFTNLQPACFNPMDWLHPDDPDLNENGMLLADALVVTRPEAKEPFWDEEARAVLGGFILYVATDPNERADRHLGRVRDLLLQDADGMKALFQKMYESSNTVVAGIGAACMQKDPRTLSNVLAMAQSHTLFLNSPRVRESMSRSDFSFEDLKTEPTTIYLVLPVDRLRTFNRWLRLLIQQAITVNARNIDVKPERPILFMLDELTSLGPLTMVEQAYRLMAGFGMQMWGIVQDASPLKMLYGNAWESFIANSGAITYHGSRDVLTSEYFSKLTGVTTVNNLSTSITHAVTSAFGGSGSRTVSNASSVAQAQRSLAYSDELMRIEGDKHLVIIDNLNPISAHRLLWFKHPELAPLGVNLNDLDGPEPPRAGQTADDPLAELARLVEGNRWS